MKNFNELLNSNLRAVPVRNVQRVPVVIPPHQIILRARINGQVLIDQILTTTLQQYTPQYYVQILTQEP